VVVVAPTPRASLMRLCLALRRRGESAPGVLGFLTIHIALAPLVALGGGLKVGRRMSRIVDGAAQCETVEGVAQVAVIGGCPRSDPVARPAVNPQV